MAEEGAVEAQEQGSEEHEQDSGEQSKASAGEESSGTSGSGSEESETSSQDQDETQAQDEEQEETQAKDDSDDSGEDGDEEVDADGMVGDFSIDDADLSAQAEDDDEARAQIKKMEKDGPPEDLKEWPTGKAMYLTFGGAEGDATYEEGETSQLGPSSTRHHADGSVEVKGEIVDNPEDFKAEKSVFDEADELGMDKSGKHDDGAEDGGEEGEEGESSGDDSESSGDESSSASAESEGDETQSEGDETQSEGERAEKS